MSVVYATQSMVFCITILADEEKHKPLGWIPHQRLLLLNKSSFALQALCFYELIDPEMVAE